MADHTRRRTPGRTPYLDRFVEMDMDERWLNRSPTEMLETFQWFRGEAFDLIVSDLCQLAGQSPVIAEGFRLLPALVAPPLADPNRAVWLLPTAQLRVTAFESRGSTWDIAGRTSDPPRARTNLLRRDAMFTDRLAAETERPGLNAIRVDTTTSESEVAARVARTFRLEPPAGQRPDR